MLNQNNRLVKVVLRNAPYLVAALTIAISSYLMLKPKADPKLELSGVSGKQLRREETSCIDGVLYLNKQGSPSAALVNSDGFSSKCENKHDTGLEQFNHRYRIFCVDNVQVVKIYELRNSSLFVRYDSNTRRPMICDF